MKNQQQINKKNKLTLDKINITKLNNLVSIYGGKLNDDDDDGSGNDTWNG